MLIESIIAIMVLELIIKMIKAMTVLVRAIKS